MSAPAITVVVPTRDRPDHLRACLAHLEAQTTPSFEVVVVDDASVDAEAVAAITDAAPHARLVLGAGQGPAAARNLGARVARAPYVAFVDDDCCPEPGWLAALLSRLEQGAAAVAGPTRNGRPTNPFSTTSQLVTNYVMDASLDAATGTLGFAPTSNLAATTALLREQLFDERYPLAAGEDRDWCARLADRGVPLQLVPDAIVVHHQQLTWPTFWRQQVRYGRGAHRFHRAGPGRGLSPVNFYLGLLRAGARAGVTVAVLVVVAQLATAVGVLQEAWADRRRGRADDRTRTGGAPDDRA